MKHLFTFLLNYIFLCSSFFGNMDASALSAAAANITGSKRSSPSATSSTSLASPLYSARASKGGEVDASEEGNAVTAKGKARRKSKNEGAEVTPKSTKSGKNTGRNSVNGKGSKFTFAEGDLLNAHEVTHDAGVLLNMALPSPKMLTSSLGSSSLSNLNSSSLTNLTSTLSSNLSGTLGSTLSASLASALNTNITTTSPFCALNGTSEVLMRSTTPLEDNEAASTLMNLFTPGGQPVGKCLYIVVHLHVTIAQRFSKSYVTTIVADYHPLCVPNSSYFLSFYYTQREQASAVGTVQQSRPPHRPVEPSPCRQM